MLMTMILAATIGQTPAWHNSANHPGWQGFGVPINGRLDPQRWRQTDNPGVEFIADGDPVPKGYTKVQDASGATGDAWGFTAWLNSTRESYGLSAVGYDQNLSSWAATNNGRQASHGIGHHIMGSARRQNVAMGGYPGIESMWMASPAHRAALLDPTIRWIGIAGTGVWWTFNAN